MSSLYREYSTLIFATQADLQPHDLTREISKKLIIPLRKKKSLHESLRQENK